MDRRLAKAGAAAAMAGGAFALAGNVLAPRYTNLDDVETYRKVASSDRFLAANLLILVALILVTVGFFAIAQSLQDHGHWAAGRIGGLAATVGGTIAIAQSAPEIYAYRQEAMVFLHAQQQDQQVTFWATDTLNKINTSLFAMWTIVFLGIAPAVLGVAMRHIAHYGQVLGSLGAVGGLVCVVTGAVNLVRTDQDATVVPFFVGSLMVTVWVLWTGYRLTSLADVDEPDAVAVES